MPRPFTLALATITTAFSLLPCAAHAQVNIETLRTEIKQNPLFGSVDASFTGRLGNTQGVVAGASVFGGLNFAERHLLFLKGQGDYAAFGGTPSVSKSFAHLRYNLTILPWLVGEAFAQVQQDKFQRLQFRNVEGIGPRFGLVQMDDFELYYGTSYMLEYEVLSSLPGGPADATVDLNHRWNNYLSLLYRFDARARFSTVIYVQPRLDAFDDIRVLSDSALIVDLSGPLKLKLNVTVRHDTQPPEGVLSTDFEGKNSLALVF
ncbi:MAG: DUF481 domain-containing protein [Byssovorax sp.]